jgi:succinate dehydrogenase / fumarate reductase flavoprotein subunit
MLDLIVVDGQARGILVRNLLNGNLESIAGDAVILATGGYSNVFFLSTNAKLCNATAAWRAYKRGAFFANPCFTQIHPTCIPVSSEHQSKLTLMSESLRNDGRIWAPKNRGDKRDPDRIPENERDYYLERMYPSFGNLVPRDVASRRAKEMCDKGFGVGPTGKAVYLDFRDTIKRIGRRRVAEKYGNLFDMYQEITGENAYETPMRIYPAAHYTMGGLWIDYNMMSVVPGLFVLGEANFSDHGANRLGASALMQGLADGYFIIPYTIGDYLASSRFKPVDSSHSAFKDSERTVASMIKKILSISGNRAVDEFHKELGEIMWNHCGMARNAAGLKKALELIPQLRERFWTQVRISGSAEDFNQELEKAQRVSDFIELGQLMVEDALYREESCGCHFREEYETEEGEAKRDDERFSFVSAWEFQGEGKPPKLHQEALAFESAKPSQRSYK